MRTLRPFFGPALVLALLFAVVVALACTRKKAIEPNALTGGTERTWRMSDKLVDGKSTGIGDCERFILYTFRADGTYSSRDVRGTDNSLCVNMVVSGTWHLENDNQILVLTSTNGNGMNQETRLSVVRLNYDKLETQAMIMSPDAGTFVMRPVNS